jgi:hypothetical protein
MMQNQISAWGRRDFTRQLLIELDFTQNYSRSKANLVCNYKKDPIGLFKFDTIPTAGK